MGEDKGKATFWRLSDVEGEWQELDNGLPSNPQVRAVAIHPKNPAIVYSGTNRGLYRSEDRGDHWEALDTPKNLVCALAFHPKNPNIMFAGFDPLGISRSDDGGETWRQINLDSVRFPHITTYLPPTDKRVTHIAINSTDPMEMYASIEVGGLLASKDGGESWEQMIDGPFLSNRTLDLHSCAVTSAAPGTVFITCAVGLFRSDDQGHHWKHVVIKEMYTLVMDNMEVPNGGAYCRGMLVAPDNPKTIYVTNNRGGGAVQPGTKTAGALFRSLDTGHSWDRVDVGETPASRIIHIAIDPIAPANVYVANGLGQVYCSSDGGNTFNKNRMPMQVKPEPALYTIGMAAG
jgi:photosystem II stability/assembly factor-like uncharacterized protein